MSEVKVLKQFKKHPHWRSVERTLLVIHRAGHVAWLAGGCVRDGLLGRVPKDFDIATNATPEQLLDLFPEALEVGRQFGVIILPFKGYQVEVATFRSDGEYSDGRRPEAVVYSSPEEDARRRDFTINALFYDVESNEIYDFVKGREDLSRRIVRAVGEPAKRFQEDQLRLLRAVRFCAQLDFDMEAVTWESIKAFKNPLKSVSRERVIEEMEKLLNSPSPLKGLHLLCETPLVEDVFLDISAIFKEGWSESWSRQFQNWGQQQVPMVFRWAWLLFYSYVKNAERVKHWVQEQPFSRKTRGDILNTLKISHSFFFETDVKLESLVIQFDRSLVSVWFFDFIQELRCQLSSRKEVEPFYQLYVNNLNEKGFLKSPLLTGADLLKMGIKKGPRLGGLLELIYQIQIRDQIMEKSLLLKHPEVRACTSKEV